MTVLRSPHLCLWFKKKARGSLLSLSTFLSEIPGWLRGGRTIGLRIGEHLRSCCRWSQCQRCHFLRIAAA